MQKLLLITGCLCIGVLLPALDFGGVHGDNGNYSASDNFKELGDNNVSAGTTGGWLFKTAEAGGTSGKTVKINDSKNGLSTSNENEEENFNYVSFTVTVGGALTKPSDEDGTSPSYALSAARDQPKYFPIFGSAVSTETNPAFLSTIKAYIPIMSNSITIGALEAMLTGENENTHFISGRKTSDWETSSPAKYYDIVTGQEISLGTAKVTGAIIYSPFGANEMPPAGQYFIEGSPTPTADKQNLSAMVNVVAASFPTSSSVLCSDNYTNSSLELAKRDDLEKGFSNPIYYSIDNRTTTTAYASVSSDIDQENCLKLKLNGTVISNEAIVIPVDQETTLSLELIQPDNPSDGELIVSGNIGSATWCPLPSKKIGVMLVNVNNAGYPKLETAPLKAANIEVETIQMQPFSYLPGKTLWHFDENRDLYNAFTTTDEYYEKFFLGYYYVIFAVPGSFTGISGDIDYSTAAGIAYGGYAVVRANANDCVAVHEMGHLLGETDFANSNNLIEKFDSDNLMHYGGGPELRYGQWKRMNDLAIILEER